MRPLALCTLASRLILAGQPEGAGQVLGEAEALAQALPNAEDQGRALGEIAKLQAALGAWDGADAVAASIPQSESWARADALREIAARLIAAGQRDRALLVLARTATAAEEIPEPWPRAEALTRVGKFLWLAGQPDSARALWAQAEAEAQAGEQVEDRQAALDCASVLWELAETLALAGDWAWAQHVAAGIANEGKRTRALEALGGLQAGRPPSVFS